MESIYIANILNKEKCDLHCHAARGAGIEYINKIINGKIVEKQRFHSISEMDKWFNSNIETYFNGREGYELLIHATIKQAIEDNVKYLELSFSIERIKLYNYSIEDFIKSIKNIIKKYSNINIIPEIAVPKISDYKRNIYYAKESLNYNFFKSVDIVGEELKIDFINFKELYRIARKKGLRLRAHVGEFGSAESIRQTCDLLELDEIQHGIHASDSLEVIQYLRNNKIQLNICPTSNVRMGIVENYNNHPIRKLYNMGIIVTINTDDRLIFNHSVTEEYLELLKHKVFSICELDNIRATTIKRCQELWK